MNLGTSYNGVRLGRIRLHETLTALMVFALVCELIMFMAGGEGGGLGLLPLAMLLLPISYGMPYILSIGALSAAILAVRTWKRKPRAAVAYSFAALVLIAGTIHAYGTYVG